jgi:hypothetical protein
MAALRPISAVEISFEISREQTSTMMPREVAVAPERVNALEKFELALASKPNIFSLHNFGQTIAFSRKRCARVL